MEGLSKYWGASCTAYSPRELVNWPISRDQLEPHYRSLAAMIGITGGQDGLSDYFQDQFFSFPKASQTEAITALLNGLPPSDSGNSLQLIPGAARLALDSRTDSENGCALTGECMTGCPKKSVFNAAQLTDTLLDTFADARQVDGTVSAIDPINRSVRLQTANRQPEISDDRIRQVGNAAIEGATLALLSCTRRRELEQLVRKIEHVPLESDPELFDEFVLGCLFRPIEP